MAQVCACLCDSESNPHYFNDLKLLKPIVVPKEGITIQVRAFKEADEIQLSILSEHNLKNPFITATYLYSKRECQHQLF